MYIVSQKNVPLCLCPYLRQILTDFHNSFTGTFRGKFIKYSNVQWGIANFPASMPVKELLKLVNTDMPTFENQKEESLTTEARKADNRGPTIEARRADKLKSS